MVESLALEGAEAAILAWASRIVGLGRVGPRVLLRVSAMGTAKEHVIWHVELLQSGRKDDVHVFFLRSGLATEVRSDHNTLHTITHTHRCAKRAEMPTISSPTRSPCP